MNASSDKPTRLAVYVGGAVNEEEYERCRSSEPLPIFEQFRYAHRLSKVPSALVVIPSHPTISNKPLEAAP